MLAEKSQASSSSSSASTSTSSNNPLEPFVILAKSAKGAAAVELIKQVLEAPGVYVFGELLEMPNILELSSGPQSKYLELLKIFAYGKYRDYLSNSDNLIELTPIQKKKLQHLTIVTLATKTKCIPYCELLQELDIKNVRDLEDLIIEAIYADIIRGKLDQKNSQLEIDYAVGRDIRIEELSTVISTLKEWCDACEVVLGCVETQIVRANSDKARRVKHKEVLEQEISNIKKNIKTHPLDPDEVMLSDASSVLLAIEKPGRKGSKVRGVKSGGKFWHK